MFSRLSRLALALVMFALAATLRLARADAVFRKQTVLAGNDAWHYRDRVLALRDGTTTVAAERGEPLFYWLAHTWTRLGDLVGVGPDTALAVLPVVLGVATVAVVGWTARHLTDDLTALVSMAILATYPGHVRRTHIGVADHHALGLFLLAALAAAVVALVQSHTSRERVTAAVGIAGATAGLALASDGSPALVAAVGLAGIALARSRRWPSVAGLVAGLVTGSVLAGGVHLALGWQSALPVLAPLAVAAGVCGLSAVTWLRWPYSAASAGVGSVSVVAAPLVAPRLADRLLDRVTGDLLGRGDIVEAQSLLDPVALNTLAPLWWLGPVAFVLPAAALVVYRVDGAAWLAIGGTLAGLAGLSLLQLRYLAALGVVGAPAVALVLVEVGRDAMATRARGVALVAVCFVAAAAVVAVTAMGAVVADDQQVAAATEIEKRGGGDVLTNWGNARLYNGLVNGESETYTRSYRHFEAVVRDERPPPDSVRWVVVDRRRLGEGYDEEWHSDEAELVWRDAGVALYRTAETHNI